MRIPGSTLFTNLRNVFGRLVKAVSPSHESAKHDKTGDDQEAHNPRRTINISEEGRKRAAGEKHTKKKPSDYTHLNKK